MLIVEDGSVILNANSYIAVADADTYHADRGNDAWALLDNTKKEQAIRRAMDYITSTYSTSWQGYRSSLVQNLDFPRRGVKFAGNRVPQGYTGLGYYLGGMNGNGGDVDYITPGFYGTYDYRDSAVIPQELKDAISELALIASTTSLNPTQTQVKKRVKVGPLEVEYDVNSPQAHRFIAATTKIGTLLGGIASSGGMVRLNRA